MENTSKDEDILYYLKILLKHKYFIIAITAVITIIAIIYVLVTPPIYSSYVTLLPTYESDQAAQLSYLKNIAGQFGGAQFPVKNISELFPEIAKSRNVLYPVLEKNFNFQGERKKLLDILNIKGEELYARLYYGYKKLLNMLSATKDVQTNITKIEVSSKYPELSADVAEAIVKELDKFNREKRTSKAKENREFIEKRLSEISDSLKIAEYNLKDFRERNLGGIENSPELQMIFQRLYREQKKWEELKLTVEKEYELAKIQEIRDAPIINILDNAYVPVEKSAPNRKIIVILAMIVGVNIGIILAFIREFIHKNKEKNK